MLGQLEPMNLCKHLMALLVLQMPAAIMYVLSATFLNTDGLCYFPWKLPALSTVIEDITRRQMHVLRFESEMMLKKKSSLRFALRTTLRRRRCLKHFFGEGRWSRFKTMV